jgi:hypothetical protein
VAQKRGKQTEDLIDRKVEKAAPGPPTRGARLRETAMKPNFA